MKKQKMIYRYSRYEGKTLHAKREVSYELKLSSRLLLDELCFNWNKEKLETAINSSIESGNKEKFLQLSEEYRHYIWE
ncbi:IDEAL domain-containing protein [Virgibacillus doumboii]|uniref:IDEAL domain-containing protein n=1 Tax=Virgibacillus doumboii TaxID=2697503 RepID=UPI0013E01557|nr:IDEAL domain-containing protein [Virgibacillus doumboii]